MNQHTARLMRYFAYQHLPEHLQAASKPCHDLAVILVSTLPDGPELTKGLNELLAAKDWFVRAAVKPGDHCGTVRDGGATYHG